MADVPVKGRQRAWLAHLAGDLTSSSLLPKRAVQLEEPPRDIWKRQVGNGMGGAPDPWWTVYRHGMLTCLFL
jgi:hypothetical protein